MAGKGETLTRFLRPLWLLAAISGALLAPSSAMAADPPLATTEAASSVGETTVTLNGKVNPSGAGVSVCRFEFGTTPTYGAALPCAPPSLGTGGFNVPVSAQLESLEAGTTYHYRVIAASANGASQGSDRTFTTPGAPACPNAARRLEQGIAAIQLPDCMALEQVSPSVKLSQRAVSPTISLDGQRVSFKTLASLADTGGNLDTINGDRYVATRSANGWVPASTVPPSPYTTGWDAVANLSRSFDPSLSRWVVLASAEKESQFYFGLSQLFRGGLGGTFESASPLLEPIGPAAGSFNVSGARLQGASADHRRLLLAPGEATAIYLPGDPVPTPGIDKNVYLAQPDAAGKPSIKLLARDETGGDAGQVWGGKCGTRVGDVWGGALFGSLRNQGAVSLDGNRIYFTTRASQPAGAACESFANKLRIMVRTETAGVANIEHLVPGGGAGECTRVTPACNGVDGDDLFQGASVDGSKVYIASSRQLADSDLDAGFGDCSGFFGSPGCDLYLYDAAQPAGQRLTQVSAGEVAPGHAVVGEGANVLNGTVAISGDGSHVYFAANGNLTADPNPEGRTADEYLSFVTKLYAWDAGSEEVRFIGPAEFSDSLLWGGRGTFLGNAYPVPATGTDEAGMEVGGSGDILVFQTHSALTAEDADGSFLDTFRYDASTSPPVLECVSCMPGGPDSEPIATDERAPSVQQVEAIGTAFAEENRWVSEDGRTILIRTGQALVPADVNGTRNDYLWRDGELTMLPGTNPPASLLGVLGDYAPVLSHDGSMVAFSAYPRLLPSDVDSNSDVYIARPGGGFPFPEVVPDCVGEGCQGPSQQRPPAQSASSESVNSKGNVAAGDPKPKRCPKGKRKVTKNGKSRCVKKKPAKTKGTAKPRAKHNQGGQK